MFFSSWGFAPHPSKAKACILAVLHCRKAKSLCFTVGLRRHALTKRPCCAEGVEGAQPPRHASEA